jgi:hypothetical protein
MPVSLLVGDAETFGNNYIKKDFQMKKMHLLLSMVILLTAGCASTAANLQRETARNIGNLHPKDVTVMDIQRGMTSVTWKAQTSQGMYDCSADDMVRRVHCVKEEK